MNNDMIYYVEKSLKTFVTWGFATESIIWNHNQIPDLTNPESPKNTQQAQKNGCKTRIRLYDVGGGRKIRGIWHNYYAEVYINL